MTAVYVVTAFVTTDVMLSVSSKHNLICVTSTFSSRTHNPHGHRVFRNCCSDHKTSQVHRSLSILVFGGDVCTASGQRQNSIFAGYSAPRSINANTLYHNGSIRRTISRSYPCRTSAERWHAMWRIVRPALSVQVISKPEHARAAESTFSCTS
jgi:hypothetical protein